MLQVGLWIEKNIMLYAAARTPEQEQAALRIHDEAAERWKDARLDHKAKQYEISLLEGAIASHQSEIRQVNNWLDGHNPLPLIEDWLLAQMDYRETQIAKIQKCINARRAR